jgi:hypothetical protein
MNRSRSIIESKLSISYGRFRAWKALPALLALVVLPATSTVVYVTRERLVDTCIT